jgi:2-hydroxycyclohexanecarboxyl-CoA dehydrogenase
MGGRVAFVTGGGGGIGGAVCAALAEAGHRVVVADLRADQAEQVAVRIGGFGVSIDVTDAGSVGAAVDRAAAEYGPIEICVNCVGWESATPFLDTDDPYVGRILDINLVGATRVCRAVLPGMVERGWGRVVNVASEAGRIGAPRSSIYAAAKGGLIALSKSVAAEVARAGVTVNVVSPGPIDTPLMSASQGPYWEKVSRHLTKAIPLGRVGEPEEAAAAVAFFASEAAGYITGQTLSVSGGLTML